MPTYEYKCSSCERKFDIFQNMKDEPRQHCPVCNNDTLKRLVGTGAGIIFKGSGFYQTDYRSDSYKKAEQKDKTPSAAPAEKTSAPKPEKAKTEKLNVKS